MRFAAASDLIAHCRFRSATTVSEATRVAAKCTTAAFSSPAVAGTNFCLASIAHDLPSVGRCLPGATSLPLPNSSIHCSIPASYHPLTRRNGAFSYPWGPAGFRGFAVGGRGGGGEEPVTEVVGADEAARRVLQDPMSRLMASQGMPVGLSLHGAAVTSSPSSGSGGASTASSSSRQTGGTPSREILENAEEEDLTRPPPAEPAYHMEALSDMLRATAAAARRGNSAAAGDDGTAADGFTAGVQHVGPSLEDSWGTTRESPADIAWRIVESNLDAEGGSHGGGVRGEVAGGDGDGNDGDDLPDLSLSPSEQKYASLEAMSAEIKKLDEVFEVLASVPWLDEDVLAEKELRGVAQVGLLGTLEEVGFNIRHQLHRIWSGERGAELAAGPGLEFRDQAALLAILYHTQQIEDEHGPPPGGYLPKPPPQEPQGQEQH